MPPNEQPQACRNGVGHDGCHRDRALPGGVKPLRSVTTKRRSARTGHSAFCLWPDLFRDPVREGASALRNPDGSVAADRHDTEVIATVLLPAGFVVLGANRALLAVAHEVEAICRDSTLDEVPLGRGRTALAEGQVVLV